MVKRLAPRLVLIQDIQIVKSLPAILLQGNQPNILLQGDKAQVKLSGAQPNLTLDGSQPNIVLSGATPSIKLAHTSQTVSLRVDSSAQKVNLPEWGGYIAWLKTGNLIPVGFAKHIAEVSTTGTIVLDQLFVLASSIPPNTQLLLYLRADVYNNGGYTTCIRASFSDATVQLCTTATAYTTLTGSATVSTLTDGWLVLDVSSVAGGTAYVKNAVALLVPRTT